MTAASLSRLEAGQSLSRTDADALMEELLAGRMAHEDIVRLLVALRAKGETVEELVGFARAMRRRMQPIVIGNAIGNAGGFAGDATLVDEFPLVDTCGTGGDA